MKIRIQIAVMSHLSDAQELLEIGYKVQANKHINFAKRLVLKYVNADEEVSTEELDKLWQENSQQSF